MRTDCNTAENRPSSEYDGESTVPMVTEAEASDPSGGEKDRYTVHYRLRRDRQSVGRAKCPRRVSVTADGVDLGKTERGEDVPPVPVIKRGVVVDVVHVGVRRR